MGLSLGRALGSRTEVDDLFVTCVSEAVELDWGCGGALVSQLVQQFRQGPRSEGHMGVGEFLARPPTDFVDVLGRKLGRRHRRIGVEVFGAVEVDVIHLAVPLLHWEQGRLFPHFRAQGIDDQAGLFAELTLHGLKACLAWFDSATWVCPEAISELESVPVKPDKQYVVLWVDDQRAHAFSQSHELWILTDQGARAQLCVQLGQVEVRIILRMAEEVAVFECADVAAGGVDREAEQVGDDTDVAAGRVGLVEDPVFARLPRSQTVADHQANPPGADGILTTRRSVVDEQVGVDRLRSN